MCTNKFDYNVLLFPSAYVPISVFIYIYIVSVALQTAITLHTH